MELQNTASKRVNHKLEGVEKVYQKVLKDRELLINASKAIKHFECSFLSYLKEIEPELEKIGLVIKKFNMNSFKGYSKYHFVYNIICNSNGKYKWYGSGTYKGGKDTNFRIVEERVKEINNILSSVEYSADINYNGVCDYSVTNIIISFKHKRK